MFIGLKEKISGRAAFGYSIAGIIGLAARSLQGPLVFVVLFGMNFGLRSPLAALGLG